MPGRLFVVFSPTLFLNDPYSVLRTFSYASRTLTVKNTHRKSLETLLAARCEKTPPDITPGSENQDKTTPGELQMDDLGTDTAYLFVL